MIYDNILRLCQERKITIARLEKECKLGNATVRNWANSDGGPRAKTLKIVADYFGVSVDELLREEET